MPSPSKEPWPPDRCCSSFTRVSWHSFPPQADNLSAGCGFLFPWDTLPVHVFFPFAVAARLTPPPFFQKVFPFRQKRPFLSSSVIEHFYFFHLVLLKMDALFSKKKTTLLFLSGEKVRPLEPGYLLHFISRILILLLFFFSRIPLLHHPRVLVPPC